MSRMHYTSSKNSSSSISSSSRRSAFTRISARVFSWAKRERVPNLKYIYDNDNDIGITKERCQFTKRKCTLSSAAAIVVALRSIGPLSPECTVFGWFRLQRHIMHGKKRKKMGGYTICPSRKSVDNRDKVLRQTCHSTNFSYQTHTTALLHKWPHMLVAIRKIGTQKQIYVVLLMSCLVSLC